MAAIINSMPRSTLQGSAGIKYVLIQDFSTVDVSLNMSTGYANFIPETSANWAKVYPRERTSSFTETGSNSLQSGVNSYAQSLTLIFPYNQTAKRNNIKLLADAELKIVVVDKNDQGWLLGAKNGLFLEAPTQVSGVGNAGEFTGSTLVFNGIEPYPMWSVDTSTLIKITP